MVEPYIADTDILLCFSPPMADHVVRDAPKLKWIQALGTGVDNIVDLPSLGKDVRRHQYPRHPWRAGVGSRHRLHAVARAATCRAPCAAQDRSSWERWPAAAARRQDRRHFRRRR